jgi:hypothetical protein
MGLEIANTTGTNNTAMGLEIANTTGTNNTAVGLEIANTTGTNNIAMGRGPKKRGECLLVESPFLTTGGLSQLRRASLLFGHFTLLICTPQPLSGCS